MSCKLVSADHTTSVELAYIQGSLFYALYRSNDGQILSTASQEGASVSPDTLCGLKLLDIHSTLDLGVLIFKQPVFGIFICRGLVSSPLLYGIVDLQCRSATSTYRRTYGG